MQVTQAGGKPIKMWVGDLSEVEDQAMQQMFRVSRLPFIFRHVAGMPDVHMGSGAAVGSVIASKGAIVPSLVGVDIGCGMLAAKLNLKASDLPDSLAAIRHELERTIPVGHNCHKDLQNTTLKLEDLSVFRNKSLENKIFERALTQIGTLGGGNHFIEVCLDENQNVWIMLHSGSRNIGKSVAEIHIEKAKGLMKQMFIKLEDPDLAYLGQGTQEYQDYINDVSWCQEYAAQNRQHMFNNTFSVLRKFFPHLKLEGVVTNCHHNYVEIENHFGENVIVTRKGAIRAREGQLGIIPGSMGTRSYIVKGLGNKESFCSCSHGTGRKMSRSEAKRQFTVEDLIAQTDGVECRKDAGAIDEIPSSYKDIDEVMFNQKDLVEIVHSLKQVLCVKG